jgi:hypothetical protein
MSEPGFVGLMGLGGNIGYLMLSGIEGVSINNGFRIWCNFKA